MGFLSAHRVRAAAAELRRRLLRGRGTELDVRWARAMSLVSHDVPASFRDRFVEAGYRERDFFPHRIRFLPRCGPDGAKLARRMTGIRTRDTAWQVVIHATSPVIDEFPPGLFFDQDLLWHQQHLHEAGQVASASVAGRGATLFSMVHQSDLVQRAARAPGHRTRLQNKLRGWHHLLVNAIGVFARRRGYEEVRIPTSRRMMQFTDPARVVQPELFERVYDRAVLHHFRATEDDGWWVVNVAANDSALVEPEHCVETFTPGRTVCIVHDTERGHGHRDVDPAFAARADVESPAALREMLAVERDAGVRTTYSVVGNMLQEVRPAIEERGRGNGGSVPLGHALAFHSYDHGEGPQLNACRQVDYRLKGYRAPRSRLTDELVPEVLCWRNFEWLASSRSSLQLDVPTWRDRLVYVPVHIDDFPMHRGAQTYDSWFRAVMELVNHQDIAVIGLHDCYASHWLPRYRELLDQLSSVATLRTIDDVADLVYRAAGV